MPKINKTEKLNFSPWSRVIILIYLDLIGINIAKIYQHYGASVKCVWYCVCSPLGAGELGLRLLPKFPYRNMIVGT